MYLMIPNVSGLKLIFTRNLAYNWGNISAPRI